MPEGVSPSGRWALFHGFGPASGSQFTHVIDLWGRRPPTTVGTSPVFVDRADTLTYWWGDLGLRPWSTLCLRSLRNGRERTVYERAWRRGEPTGGKVGFCHLGGDTWNAATGELFFQGLQGEGKDEVWALCVVRLRDGHFRRIDLPGVVDVATAPRGRVAVTLTTERTFDAVPSVWLVDPTGKYRRRVVTGSAVVAWLDAGRHLLIARRGGTKTVPSTRVFRLDVNTGKERFLCESTGTASIGALALSPSRQWLGVLQMGTLVLVSTADGRRFSLPLQDISHFFWGSSDRALFVRNGMGWQRAELAIG